jgi:tRNA threonylcarbamoyl adenosine modification protein YeaZ
VLAVDTATPLVSVAIALGDRLLAAREGGQRESSARLIGWIDETLAEAGLALPDLAGAVALRGPGSFTGLRVGLATLLGIHQAIGLPVHGLPTLEVLAAAAASDEGRAASPGARVVALVPAGPGEWFVQPFAAGWPPRALGEAQRLPASVVSAGADDGSTLLVVAHEDERARLGQAAAPVWVTGALAPAAARLASRHPPAWDAALLSAPLYLAPAPVTVPGAPKPVLPLGAGTPGRGR